MEYIAKEGLLSYESTKNRGITSLPYGEWDDSFTISDPISAHIEQSISFAKKPKITSFLEMESSVVFERL